MALPPGFLDELRARTPIAVVIGRRVRLARSGRQWKGCCPFHGEKTPSFYVYDDHFHCFGCGAHGDAVSFVMQTQGMAFPEAVEQLAGEAGLDVPKPSRAAAEAERRRLGLNDVLAAAAGEYERLLRAPEGTAALDYLRKRGLSEATIGRFGLGWSGAGRGTLLAELARGGMEAALVAESGLTRAPEEGRAPQELFFNRVMFPIRDRRGRVISFGGRTLGDGQPKYLNGPETALFSKRRTLYGLDLAREAVHRGAKLIVVEGYMDVIALHQAGFAGAVAPLGTALTPEQLEELWRVSPEPVLCFDGDAAGARAAARALEVALPLLGVQQSLRIAQLGGGEDPDSLLRRGDRAGFEQALAAARPPAPALFDLAREAAGDGTPESRARLSARLEELAGRVADRALAWEYRKELRRMFKEAYPPAGARGTPARRPRVSIVRPVPGPAAAAAERGRHLVAILLRHPGLLHDVEEAFGAVALPEQHDRLRHAILAWGALGEALDSTALMTHLTSVGLAAEAAQALSAVPAPLAGCASADAMPAEAEAGWWHFFGLMNPVGLDEEVAAAQRDLGQRADSELQRRLVTLVEARNALRRGEAGEA